MVQSLVREVPLEEEMAAHSTILAWKSHGQRSLAGYRPWVCKRVGHALAIKQEQTDHSIGRLVTCLALSEKTTLIFFGHLTHKKSHSEVGNLKIVCFCSMYCQ